MKIEDTESNQTCPNCEKKIAKNIFQLHRLRCLSDSKQSMPPIVQSAPEENPVASSAAH